jgi:ribose 5-phosphate isomerase A
MFVNTMQFSKKIGIFQTLWGHILFAKLIRPRYWFPQCHVCGNPAKGAIALRKFALSDKKDGERCMMTDQFKQTAGEAAAKRIQNTQRIGLGTGSTVRYFLEALGRRLVSGELFDVVGVPTSKQTEMVARSVGVPLTRLEAEPALDLCVDGADEVDPQLNLIKGLGGALLREKIVALASRRFIIIVDDGKLVEQLGQRSPVPAEVLPFGWKATAEKIKGLGGKPELRMDKGSPYITDQDNHILDCHFGTIGDAERLAQQLDSIPGVLCHGLFLNIADEVIIGTSSGASSRTR